MCSYLLIEKITEFDPLSLLRSRGEMTNHYLVHWDGYQANLQASFERQFLAESFVDVTLAVDSGLIKCHRVVLCAASAYFQQLLSQHNCSHPIIFMRDMQYWEVRCNRVH